jgi:hypothetical protein
VGQGAFGPRPESRAGSAFNTSDNWHCLTRQGSAPDFMLRLMGPISFDLRGSPSTYEALEDQVGC